MSYDSLLPLHKKIQSPLSVQKFQERVNIVFHDFEAAHYDKMHSDMWGSLQEQINLLVDDLFAYEDIKSHKLSLLDIGCGTGLSTQILLNSKLGEHIEEITLLDTSSNMLKFAEEKAKTWQKKYKTVNAYLSELDEKFDVIIISSVLHHIPDLDVFLQQVNGALNHKGLLIHIQDPNGDFLNDAEYNARKKQYEKELDLIPKKKKIKDYLPKKIIKSIKRLLNRKDYIDSINDKLLAESIIKKRMTADEIWSVTDIHVETKNDTLNKGISLDYLKKQLPNFELIKMRSYCFFGVLKSDLIDSYKEKESKFIAENQVNGRNISCIWIKK
ncbi:class I SAM-dependent methyltransferase [Flavobacterium paronense]|uniref:Class I SAM-dependent methyltransferase n=1 Tax=Flavobacterium paronense TaxID=1392775 RepID=A0ABV5GBN3_9FLAO|nr:class I SAM-dependent methyltransferase [Flavobacterium paronense]MDN3676721.1 class I SAM-dependent methyltransferase [Flavobacterium paronense]